VLDHDRERPVAVAAQAGRAVADGIPADRAGDQVATSIVALDPRPSLAG